jgi:cytochrome P450 family 6
MFDESKYKCNYFYKFSETIRVCPPVATLHRKSEKAYKLSNGNILPVGTTVVIPVLAFHRDPTFYPNPMEFDPDRFNDDVKAKRHPFSYLPFGEGPRYCIGQRFGLLQIKLGLAMLLKNFEFSICERTEIPLKIDIVNLMHTTKGAVYLRIKKC